MLIVKNDGHMLTDLRSARFQCHFKNERTTFLNPYLGENGDVSRKPRFLLVEDALLPLT